MGSDVWVEAMSRSQARISIHAPRVGSDIIVMPGLEKSQYKISIHAPRVGSDLFVFPDPQLPIYFNPRSPCGERPQAYLMAAQLAELFQSTLPVWGATLRFGV